MSQSLGNSTITGTLEKRTWRITCYCENDTDYMLEAHREQILTNPDGSTLTVINKNDRIVRRFVSQVMSDQDAINFLNLGKNLCDKWAQEDEAAGL